jgi:tripartite motif-containing protein 2/3
VCDGCGEPFDISHEDQEEQRVPLMLRNCGHTLCSNCVRSIFSENPEDPTCMICDEPLQEQRINDCKQNMKLIHFMESEEAVPVMMGTFDSIPCPRHVTKLVEYFCKTCSESVCVKCIYDEHNGHSLIPVSEMANSLKQNVIDLRKMIDNTKRLIDENSVLVRQVRDELERLMEVQISNIKDGFSELMRKLQEKKQDIITGFERKYKREEQRLMNKQELIDANASEIKNIERIFNELVEFVEVSNDAQILQKI